MTTFDKVYAAVRLIPRGSVATYGQIAAAIGNRRLARVVGYALHVNPEPGVIPCHRVVKRDGELVKLDDFEMKQQLYEVDGEQQYKYGLYFGYEEKTVGTVLKNTWYTALDFARLVWMSLGDLVSGLVSVNDMSGPVGIVSAIAQTGQSAATTADGILNVLYLGAFIAINLAVMNMLPLPALDGGRAFLLLVNTVFTAITKKKIPSKFEGYIHAAGMILLLGFIAFITFKDIWKLVR